MKFHLRFGMQRDKPYIHQEKDRIDGLVIPAHILAHQTPSTSVFVSSLPDKEYLIDPMTFVFQSRIEALVNQAGKLRPSIAKMCNAYHTGLADELQDLSYGESLRTDQFPPVEELSEGVLEFQKETIEGGSSTSAANKYLSRYGVVRATLPRAVVPPYFFFDQVEDEWYEFSLECASTTGRITSDFEVAPIIACGTSTLSTGAIDRLVDDYSSFNRVIVWINEFSQTVATNPRIGSVRSLIRRFQKKNIAVETLYGGYMMMLMHRDGLAAFSHGTLYTEHKSKTLMPGSGGPAERYYIPKFHEFRSLSQTDLILHRHPELLCECPVCETHLQGNPDNIVKFGDSPELLLSHFLHVRRQEVEQICGRTVKDLVEELQSTFDTYHESISELPNPDAFISGTPMKGLSYLREWIAAFS